jgi:hypothetical protein
MRNDLLLNWVIIQETKSFRDGFGLGEKKSGFLGPFTPEAHWLRVDSGDRLSDVE